MRRSYLVCYDIRDPKRWRRVFKVMKAHGEHWQYSVFFCVLSPSLPRSDKGVVVV
jgi:CRISPR-associated protein Cas2